MGQVLSGEPTGLLFVQGMNMVGPIADCTAVCAHDVEGIEIVETMVDSTVADSPTLQKIAPLGSGDVSSTISSPSEAPTTDAGFIESSILVPLATPVAAAMADSCSCAPEAPSADPELMGTSTLVPLGMSVDIAMSQSSISVHEAPAADAELMGTSTLFPLATPVDAAMAVSITASLEAPSADPELMGTSTLFPLATPVDAVMSNTSACIPEAFLPPQTSSKGAAMTESAALTKRPPMTQGPAITGGAACDTLEAASPQPPLPAKVGALDTSPSLLFLAHSLQLPLVKTCKWLERKGEGERERDRGWADYT